jgi:hypothetical protein
MTETVIIDSVLDEIIDRIQLKPSLIHQIHYALPILRYEFGESAEFLLEPYHDPEFCSQEVHLIVRCPDYSDDFMDRISKCRKYLCEHGNLKELLITTDYHPVQENDNLQVIKDRINRRLNALANDALEKIKTCENDTSWIPGKINTAYLVGYVAAINTLQEEGNYRLLKPDSDENLG